MVFTSKSSLANFMVECWNKYWSTNNKLIDYFLVDHLIRLFYDKTENFRAEINYLPIESPDLYFFKLMKLMKISTMIHGSN